MRYKSFLLFGPPGAGKGTVGKIVASATPGSPYDAVNEPGLYYLATGDMVRGILANDEHELKAPILSYITEGKLIPDELICDVFRNYLVTNNERISNRFLFIDGIPRTYPQAQSLDDILEVKAIFNFTNLPNSTLKRRMLNRAKQALAAGKKPRDDDNEQAIDTRIADFYKETYPTLDFYTNNGTMIVAIDGIKEKFEVYGKLFDAVHDVLHHISDDNRW